MQTKFKLFEDKEQSEKKYSIYYYIPYGITWRCRVGRSGDDWYIDDKSWIPLKIAIGKLPNVNSEIKYFIIDYLSGQPRCKSLYIIISPDFSAWNVYLIQSEEDIIRFKKNYKNFEDGGEIKVEKWEIESYNFGL